MVKTANKGLSIRSSTGSNWQWCRTWQRESCAGIRWLVLRTEWSLLNWRTSTFLLLCSYEREGQEDVNCLDVNKAELSWEWPFSMMTQKHNTFCTKMPTCVEWPFSLYFLCWWFGVVDGQALQKSRIYEFQLLSWSSSTEKCQCYNWLQVWVTAWPWLGLTLEPEKCPFIPWRPLWYTSALNARVLKLFVLPTHPRPTGTTPSNGAISSFILWVLSNPLSQVFTIS